MASNIPTGAKSNIRKGAPRISSRTRETMILGEVPTRVTMPPSSEPNAIGISMRGGRRAGPARQLEGDRHHHGERADILYKARQSRDHGRQHENLDASGVDRYGASGRSTFSITPERATAALTTSALATMMTISSEKPENALS